MEWLAGREAFMANRQKRRSRSERRAIRNRMRARLAARRRLQLESLEPRILLTTLFGGEVFEYISANPTNPAAGQATVRVTVEGDNSVVEVVAVDIDDNNQALLGDLPGNITASDIRNGATILGGAGGAQGVQLIGQTPINEPTTAPGDIGLNNGADINFQALASAPEVENGITYGFNIGDVTVNGNDRTVVQLADLSTTNGGATVDAVFHQGTLGEDIVGAIDNTNTPGVTLNNVQASAIDPTTGLMYVINNEGGQAVLYQLNRSSGAIIQSFGPLTNTTTGRALTGASVEAMAFRADGTLFFITRDYDGNGNADASGLASGPDPDGAGPLTAPTSNQDVALVNLGLATAPGFDANFTNAEAQSITTGGFEITTRVTGMAFHPTNGQLFATSLILDDQDAPTGTNLLRMTVGAGATVAATNVGTIDAGGDVIIQAVAFTTTYNINTGAETPILVGIDHSQADTNGVTQARMVLIATGAPGNSSLLSEAGAIETVSGLSSFTEPGQTRPLLYAISDNGANLIRGSAVVLPMDGEMGTTAMRAITAADFHPIVGSANDGLLFFIGQDGDSSIDRLWSVDVTLGNRSAIQNSLRMVGNFGENANNARNITAMVFDQTSDTTARLIVYDAANQVLSLIDNLNATATADFNDDSDADTAIRPIYRNQSFGTRITGLAVLETPDANGEAAPEEFVIAIDNNGANSNLIRIRLEDQVDRGGVDKDDTNVYILGPLPDPTDNAGARRGANLQDLTWNPVLANPFTGEQGVLLATDASDDSLLYIDSRARFPTADSFLIYVSQGDANTVITVSVIEDADNQVFADPDGQREALPFGGGPSTPTSFRVANAQSGQLVLVTGNAETGGALLGARTEDLNVVGAGAGADDRIPILLGDLQTVGVQQQVTVGVIPSLFDMLPNDPDNEFNPGVLVTESLLKFVSAASGLSAKVMGANLDNIREMTVTRDGSGIFVVNEPTALQRQQAAAAAAVNNPIVGNIGTLPTPDVSANVGMLIDAMDLDPNAFSAQVAWPFQMAPGDPFTLTYSYSNLLDGGLAGGLTATQIRAAIEEGLALWAQFVPINFVEVPDVGPLPDDADTPYTAGALPLLRIGHHFIDGASGANVLAHAFFPDPLNPTQSGLAGDLHFDDGNTWDYTQLLEVFVHELGHALGLGHSTTVSNRVGDPGPAGPPIMNPFLQDLYNGPGSAFLFQDDVDGIQALYGAGVGSVTPLASGAAASGNGATLATLGATGSAIATVSITDARTGDPLFDIQGLDMADVDFDGQPNFGRTIGTSGEDMFAILDVDDPIPQDDLGNVAGGLNIVAVTVQPGGTTYAINSNGGEFELYKITRSLRDGTVTGATLIGSITDFNGVPITDVNSIETNPNTGLLFIVGTDADGDQALFTVLPQAVELDQSETPPTIGDGDDEVLATPVAKLNGGGVTDSVTGLSFTLTGTTLFGAQTVGGVSHLITIDTANGNVTDLGEIDVDSDGDLVGDQTVVVAGLDFNSETGSLLAIDRGGSSGGGRIIKIIVADPTVSRQYTDPGTVDATLGGYSADTHGFMFSIDNASGDLLRSLQDLPTLGTIDPTSGSFFIIGVIPGVDHVDAMAFSPGEGATPGQQGLYIAADGQLFEVNYTLVTPSSITVDSLTTIGQTIDPATFRTVTIDSMDFDRAGNLFGHDAALGRLVDIDITSGFVGTQTATTQGSLRPTVGAIAFDFANDRFLASDNAFSKVQLANEANVTESAALMEIIGTHSNSAKPQDIGSLLYAGAVTGVVNISGSVDTFYAGWLLTGNTAGDLEFTVSSTGPSLPANFTVAGDLRNLLTTGSIGTLTNNSAAPTYMTGFDLQVNGRVGQIRSLADLIGQFNIVNDPGSNSLTAQTLLQTELEARNQRLDGTISEGDIFNDGFIDNFNNSFLNDTFDTAQRLGTIRNGVLGQQDVVAVQGTLRNGDPDFTTIDPFDDVIDYYSVALMAGQTVTVQLTTLGLLPLNIGVFDPDGRLVYTDYDNLNPDLVQNQAFQFTADRPGEWRFAIAFPGDVNFNGIEDGDEVQTRISIDDPYLLTILGAGEMGLGGLVVDGNFYNHPSVDNVTVLRGDFGGLSVGGNYFNELVNGLTGDVSNSITVGLGNLRSVEAGEIGSGTNTFGLGPIIDVPNGSVGMVRSLGSHLDLGGLGQRAVGGFAGITTGGNIQVIDGPNANIDVFLVASGGLGVLRGSSMTPPALPFIALNADRTGNDGILDLMDFAGNIFAPNLSTGPGGNVRYARVGGSIAENPLFGGGQAITMHSAGAPVFITDDGGALLSIRPTVNGLTTNTDGSAVTANLDIVGFGVSGSGGIVITSITSSGGLDLTVNAQATRGSAEVGVINVNGAGTAVSLGADGTPVYPTPAAGATQNDLIVDLNAGATGGAIDVLQIVGGNFARIFNHTTGELINVNASSIGDLRSFGEIGLARTHFGGDLIANAVINNTFPFNQQTTGIVVTGSVVNIGSAMGIGNLMIGGSVASINPNGDVTGSDPVTADTVGVFEGINAPIVIGGDLKGLSIGEGVLPSGTGDLARAGVFVGGTIERISNFNNRAGSDIRGDIMAGDRIGRIDLTNASIVNADILVDSDFSHSREFVNTLTLLFGDDTVEDPIFEIGSINITGNGGMIGAFIAGSDIGDINVRSGFGILNSLFVSQDDGVIRNTTVDGLGLINVTFLGGTNQGNITATGTGATLNVQNFNESVRQSETLTFDPFSGQTLNGLYDLHAALGTTSTNPAIDGVTTAGQINTVTAAGSRDLGTVRGFNITDSSFDFANSIAAIITLDDISGSEFTTGRLGQFVPRGDLIGTSLTLTGLGGSLAIRGDFDANSSINISGPNARLISLAVLGDFAGTFTSGGYISSVYIAGDLTGSFTITGHNAFGFSMGAFRLDGSMFNNSFLVNGNVSSMFIAGSLGDPTNALIEDTLTINGNLGSLVVGGSGLRTLDGAALAMDVMIQGDLNSLVVFGKVSSTGSVTVRGNLRSAQFIADTETGNAADPAPTLTLGDLTDGVNNVFDARALAQVDAQTLFAVNFDAINGNFELRRINLLPNGQIDPANAFTDLGTINSGGLNGAGVDILQIAALEFDAANNRLLLVGTTGVNLELFSIDLSNPAMAIASVGTLMLNAAPIAAGGNLNVNALAIDDRNTPTVANGDILYGILHDSAGSPAPTDTLITIVMNGAGLGNATSVGTVLQGGIDTDIIGMDFITQNGVKRLVALHDDTTITDDAQLLVIDTRNGVATAITDPGAVDENLHGFTGFNGHAVSINADPARGQDQLWRSNHSVVDGSIIVGGDLFNVVAVNGDLNARISAGRNINNVTVSRGSLGPDSVISSTLGNITRVAVVGGDLQGDLFARNGQITSVVISGGDFMGNLAAKSLGVFNVTGSIRANSSFDIARDVRVMNVGGDWETGTSITAGSVTSFVSGGDFMGTLVFGYDTRPANVLVRGNFTGTAVIDNDAVFTVLGNFGLDGTATVVPGASLIVSGDLLAFRSALFEGDLIAAGTLRSAFMTGITNSVITAGFDIFSLRSTGTIANSLIQAGVSPGEDLTFGTGDPGEGNRMGMINSLVGTNFNNSIAAAGGLINVFMMTAGMNGSTVLSGFSVGTGGVAMALADATPLGSATEINAIRGNATRRLMNGNINNGIFGTMAGGSVVAAGVDPGAFDTMLMTGGDFTTPSVFSSVTGGASMIRSLRATGAGNVFTDAGVLSDGASAFGVTVNAPVTYGDAQIAPGGLEALIGTATNGSPVTFTGASGNTTTIILTGPGSVEVRDGNGADDVIDSLVLRGTTAGSSLIISTRDGTGALAPNANSVGRIIGDDDAALARLTMDLALAGHADPFDFWIDGGVRILSVGNMPINDASWNGRIGSDVASMTIGSQGPGTWRIGGTVSSLTIADSGAGSTGFSLLQQLGTLPAGLSATVTNQATDSTGSHFVFDAAAGLVQVTIPVGPGAITVPGAAQIVSDIFNGQRLSIDSMDFDAMDQLIGITQTVSRTPTVALGTLSPNRVSISALAVAPSLQANGTTIDRIFGINTTTNAAGQSIAQLVEFNPTTGGMTVIGTIRDLAGNQFGGHVLQIASDDSGQLYALIDDRDGTGTTFTTANGVALARLGKIADSNGNVQLSSPDPTTPFKPPAFLDDDAVTVGVQAVTDDFVGMAIDSTGQVYAARRTLGGDTIVLLGTTADANNAVTVTTLGTVAAGATPISLVGIGFDENDNLIGYNNDGTGAEMLLLGSVGGSATLASLGINITGNDIALTDIAGTNITVDLTGAVTINDALNAINSAAAAAGSNLRAQFDPTDNSRLLLTDSPVHPVTGANGAGVGANAATRLGLVGIDGLTAADHTNDLVLHGSALAGGTVTGATLLSTFGVAKTGNDLKLTDTQGIVITVDLTAATTVQDALDAINTAAGLAGSNLVASIDADGRRLDLTDQVVNPITVTDGGGGGANAATLLGIVGVDGATAADTTADQMFHGASIATIGVGNATLLTAASALPSKFEAFAMGRSGAIYRSYAVDTDFGSNAATALGLAGVDGKTADDMTKDLDLHGAAISGALLGTDTLASLGVKTLGTDLVIKDTAGRSFSVSLIGAVTVQDAIDAINNAASAAGSNITVAIDPDGMRLTLTDVASTTPTLAITVTDGTDGHGQLFVNASATTPLSTPLVPQNILGGDLGGTLNLKGIAIASAFGTTDQYYAVALDDKGTATKTDDTYSLLRIVRDPVTGAISSVSPTFGPTIVTNGTGGGANAAAKLGLLGTDGATTTDNSADLVFHGTAIGAVSNATLLSTLGVTTTINDLKITDINGVTFSVSLTGATTLGDAITKINTAAMTAGSSLTAQIDADGFRLDLVNVAPATAKVITDSRLPGPNAVRDINAFAANGNLIYVVGTRGNAATQELYLLNKTTGAASSLGQLKIGGVAVTDSVVNLAFDSGGNLFATLAKSTGQQLVKINPLNGTTTVVGNIIVDGNPANIVDFAFNASNQLIGYEADPTAGDGAPSRVVKINTTNPAASVALTAFGSLDRNLRGLAIDDNGTSFSFFSDGRVNDQLWTTPDPSVASVFGIIDPLTGQYSQMRSLAQDFNGTALTSRIASMTVDTADSTTIIGDIFVLTADGRLFQYDSTQGGALVGSFGKVVNSTGATLTLTAIESDDAADDGTVNLIAVDARFNQLVRIRLSDTNGDMILDTVDFDGDGVRDAGIDIALTTADTDGDGVADVASSTTVRAFKLTEAGAVSAAHLLDLDVDPTGGNGIMAVIDTPTVGAADSIASFLDTSDTALGGIIANGFRSVRITDPVGNGYSGRLISEGNSPMNVLVMGNYSGSVVTQGSIGAFTVLNGNFAGTVSARDNITRVAIVNGSVLAGGVVHTSGMLTAMTMSGRDLTFAGAIDAAAASVISIQGDVKSAADILIAHDLNAFTVLGAFEGGAEFGSVRGAINVTGELGSGAWIKSDNDAGAVIVRGGTETGSKLLIGGATNLLMIGGTHRGMFASKGDVRSISLANLDSALVAVGMQNISTAVSGNMTSSVISYGVWVGDDGVYNTVDDRIFGGGTNVVSIRGSYVDSVVAAGVLPNLNEAAVDGTANLPLNTRAYTGYTNRPIDGAVTFVDAAEAGGVLSSIISRFIVAGQVSHTKAQTGVFGETAPFRESVIAAADGIGLVSGANSNRIARRVYGDPFGAPTVDQVLQINDSRFDIVFSEEINTSSFILSVDANDDNDINDPVDTIGTILIQYRDELDPSITHILDDGVQLTYSVSVDNNGQTHGVLHVIRDAGFSGFGGLTVTLSDNGATGPAIYDRSGGRSIFRSFNQGTISTGLEAAFGGTDPTSFDNDPFGTILDGNIDGVEGGRRVVNVFFDDAPDDFLTALDTEVTFDLASTGHDQQQVSNIFESATDIDIFHFVANAFQFFSVNYEGNSPAQMGVFVRDTQGTDDTSDDTFEAIARWESNAAFFGDGPTLFQAFELPPMEAAVNSAEDLLDGVADGLQTQNLDFFVVVTPAGGFLSSSASSNYTLTMNLANSDELLDGNAGNSSAGLPDNEQILYLSQFIGEHNNSLGANVPKQLVYLNFVGGRSDKTSEGVVNLDALTTDILDPTLAGFTNVLINGGTVNGQNVNGIIDNVLSIYRMNPADHPLGTLTVQNIGANIAAFTNASSGLYFTTIDPASLGFDGEFTTVFIGDTHGANAGLLGIASTVDFGNNSKNDEAIIYADSFAGLSSNTNLVGKLNEYSTTLANVIAHELGHTLGLNHHPTTFMDNPLFADDPDNDPFTANDANTGLSLMAYNSTASELVQLLQLGTQNLTTNEFPIGQSDTMDLILKWLGSGI
ncbi:MAG: matrixin family metalloprotease [Planctomycetes bacterium]|nr:matrixin family metalloprotease [Planctomycetota bacterium]